MSSPNNETGDLVDIGRIRRAVGLDGRVEVEIYSGDASRLAEGARVFANGSPITVKKTRAGGRGGATVVIFEGFEDRNGAESLRGMDLQLPQSELPTPAEGSYYHFEVIGCEVRDVSGAKLGTVTGVMETGSNDVFVVESPEGKEMLIPSTRDVIKSIDRVERLITIDPPDGLIS